MSGTKHTPGPWKNARRADGRLVVFHVSPQPAGEFCSAEPADPEYVANMRLLDAGPDMLAALQTARDCVYTDRTSLADCHMSPVTNSLDEDGAAGVAQYDAVLAEIDAAIAKATGAAS